MFVGRVTGGVEQNVEQYSKNCRRPDCKHNTLVNRYQHLANAPVPKRSQDECKKIPTDKAEFKAVVSWQKKIKILMHSPAGRKWLEGLVVMCLNLWRTAITDGGSLKRLTHMSKCKLSSQLAGHGSYSQTSRND